MGLESVNYIADLVATNPVNASDSANLGDAHLRAIKRALLQTFPNFAGAPVTKTEAELNATVVVPELKIVTATTTVNNSTTLVDITGLTGFALTTDKWYALLATLRRECANDTPDLKIGFQFSNAPQSLFALGGEKTSAGSRNRDAIFSVAETLEFTLSVTTPGAAVMQILALFQANATTGGTLDLQMAQLSASAVDTDITAGDCSVEQLD